MIIAMSDKRSSQTTTNVNSSTVLHLTKCHLHDTSIVPRGINQYTHHMVHSTPHRINPPTSNLYIVLSEASCSITPVMAFHQRLANYKTVPTQYYGFPPTAPCCPNCVQLPPSLGSLLPSVGSPPVETTRTLMNFRGGLHPPLS